MKVGKRIFSLFCTMVLVLTLMCSTNTQAAVSYSDKESVANLKDQISARMLEIDSYFDDVGTGQYGLLNRLRLLTEYEMYAIYVDQYGGQYGFTSADKEFYFNTVKNRIESFNATYSAQSDNYTALTLTLSDNVKKSAQKNLMSEIPDYVRALCKQINDVYQSKEDDAAKSSYLKENATLLTNLYRVLVVFQDAPRTLNSMSLELENGKTTKFSANQSGDNKALNKIIRKIATDYAEILSYGKKLATSTINTDSLEVDLEKEITENLTNGVANKKQLLDFEDDPALAQSYLAILACSSVYTPFSSYVGSPEFTTALKELALTEDESVVDDLLELYNKSKDLKKPLYKRDIDQNGNPTGTAQLITIDSFLDDVQNGDVGALIVAKGDFHYNTDAGSWIYSQRSFSADKDTSILENTETKEENSDVDSTESTEDTTDGDAGEDTGSILEKMQTWFNSLTAKATEVSDEADDEVVDDTTSAAENGDGADYTSPKTLASTISNTIFIGNENMNALKSALTTDTEVSEAALKKKGVYFKKATKISKLKKGGSVYKSVKKIVEKNPDTNFQVIFMMDPNCVSEKVDDFLKYAKDFAAISKSVGVTIQSILPVDETKTDSYKNADIQTWNGSILNSSVYDADKISYVDVTTKLLNNDGSGYADGYATSASGTVADVHTITTAVATSLGLLNSEYASDEVSDVDTTLDEESKEDNAVEEIIDDLSTALYANKNISDETKMSAPVLVYGMKYNRQIDNMTSAILQNIIKECVTLDSIKDKSTRYLYMNCYGDILTDDGLVILPGIANPLLYDTNTAAYNPYTVAFMNSYPSILNRSYYFQVTNENDIGKYCMFSSSVEKESAKDSSVRVYKISERDNVQKSNYKDVLNINPSFYANATDNMEIMTPQRFVFGSLDTWANSTDSVSQDFYDQSPIVQSEVATVDNKIIFPYVAQDDADYKVASVIAKNAYVHIAYDLETSKYTNVFALRDSYIINNFILTNCYGTNNATGYAKNDLVEYDNFVGNSNSRITQQIVQYSDDFLDKTSDVDGVIGLKTAYEDTILGKVTRAVQENWWLFIIVVVLILLISFMKMHKDLIETIVLTVVSVGVTYCLVFIVPVYLSMFYNVAINNICENLSYEVVGVKTENRDANLDNTLQVDKDGKLKLNTASITLYKVAARDLRMFYNSVNVASKDVTAGHTEILNQDAGIFVEGDSLKVNLDLLFETLNISGENEEMDGTAVYQLASQKTVSNNVDYYVPYYQIVDNFIEKLNTLAQVYEIPRSTTTYADGVNKDNYLVYSYLYSAPFLNPNSYEIVEQEEVSQYVEDYNALVTRNQQLAADLKSAFGSNGDWLGCHAIFTQLTEESKKTLWAQAMQKNGYYDENWNPDEEKINDLIVYINRQTKDFMFDIQDQIGVLSDSTMIKLISLRALVAFTQRVSKFGNYLYPFSINYAELSLQDVLAAVFTDNYEAYIAYDMDIASYIANEYGWIHLIVFDVLVLLMLLFISTIKIVIPLLYCALCVLLVVKIVLQGDVKATIRGYAKSSIFIFLLFTIFDAVLIAVKQISAHPLSIYLLLFVTLVMSAILLTVLFAIISNILDLGDREFGNKMMALANVFHLDNAFNNVSMQAQTLNPSYRRRSNSFANVFANTDRLQAYSLNNDVDDMYVSGDVGYGETYTDLSDVSPQDIEMSPVDDLGQYGTASDIEYVSDLGGLHEDTTQFTDDLR